ALARALVGARGHARRHVVDRDRLRVLADAAVLVADLALDGAAAVVAGRAARGARATEGAVAGAAVEGIREAGRGVRARRVARARQRERDRIALVDVARRVERRG